MVFVPFTGVDNHKKTITFAVGLLLKEDTSAYVWLFENFKKAMGNEPNILLTDQDGAVKAAVEQVFHTSVHRFCMWHIMFKLPAKVEVSIYNNQEFRQRFNNVVWSNDYTQEEFEEGWKSVIDEYNLGDKPWFTRMFELRKFWIPSFFDNVKMGGLLRTTSRSESQNNFFSTFIGARSSLVEFLMQYDSAIDAQRHTKLKLDFTTSTCYPSMKTHLPIEKHCASIYTIDVFYDIQEEIFDSIYYCSVSDLKKDGGVHTYEIRVGEKIYIVKYQTEDSDVICSCKCFMNTGKPCSHMFTVFKNNNWSELPTRFITSRWTKEATLNRIFEVDGTVYEECAQIDEKKLLVNELISEMHSCINLVEDDIDGMKELLALMKNQSISYKTKGITEPSASSSNTNFQKFVGPLPTEVSVHPPKQARNKGSRPKRLKSGKEISMENAKKQQRMCAKCNKYGHNIRTCKD